MAKIELRPIKPGDYEALYNEPLKHSIRGWVATIDGVPKGISGLAYVDQQVSVFSKSLPDLPKTWVARGTVLTLKMLRESNCPALAVADPDIPTAPEFLKRCGFEEVSINSQGRIFRWRQQQH